MFLCKFIGVSREREAHAERQRGGSAGASPSPALSEPSLALSKWPSNRKATEVAADFLRLSVALGRVLVAMSIGFGNLAMGQSTDVGKTSAVPASGDVRTSEERFQAMDEDHDGMLTEMEFVSQLPKVESKQPHREDDEKLQRTLFKDHDLNKDDRLSFQELQTLPDENPTDELWFTILNRSTDEALDYDEFMTYVSNGDLKERRRQFILADQDDDLKVSLEEFKSRASINRAGSPEEAFRIDDLNLDGSVSREEFVRKEKEGVSADLNRLYYSRWFDVLDSNRDGQIDPSEHLLRISTGIDVAFVRKDLDCDNRLTIEEMFPIAKNAKARKSNSQKQVNEFRLYDENEDGFVSELEYQSYVNTLTKFQALKVVERWEVEKTHGYSSRYGPSPPAPLPEPLTPEMENGGARVQTGGVDTTRFKWATWGLCLATLIYGGWVLRIVSRVLFQRTVSSLKSGQ